VNARILIFVLDLVSPEFDAGLSGGFFAADTARAALLLGEDVAYPAEAGRQVARCLIAGHEVLVELLRAWREHRTKLPVDALELRFALTPEQRVAVSGERHDVRAGAVLVRLLVRGGCDLRDVHVHRAVGERELDVERAGAAFGVVGQTDLTRIGDEVRLPGILAGFNHVQVAAAIVVVFATGDATRELVREVEDEVVIVEQFHHHRRVGRHREPGAFDAARVEVPVLRVERNRKHTAWTPLELPRVAVGKFELRAAATVEHEIDRLVEMVYWLGRFPGRHLEDEHRAKVAATGEVRRRAFRAVARPIAEVGLHRMQREPLMNDQSFALDPIVVGVDPEGQVRFWFVGRCHGALPIRRRLGVAVRRGWVRPCVPPGRAARHTPRTARGCRPVPS